MKKTIKLIDDRAQLVDAYHEIMDAAEAYTRVACNIPRNLCEVSQHIYGRFDLAGYHVMRAANEHDHFKKAESLEVACEALFYQYNSLELLVKSHGMTVGAANEVIERLAKAYNSVKRWKNSTIRNKAKML